MEREYDDLLKENDQLKREISQLRSIEHGYNGFIAQSKMLFYRWEFKVPMPVDLPLSKVYDWAREYLILADCNEAIAQFYGAGNVDRMIGKSFYELISLNRYKFNDIVRLFFNNKYCFENFVSKYVKNTGETIWLIYNAHSIIVDGYIHSISGAISSCNVNNNERSIEFKNDEHRYGELMEISELVVWEIDVHTFKFNFVSPAFKKIFACPASDMVDFNDWVKYIHKDDRQIIIDKCIDHSTKPCDFSLEYRIVTESGEEKWIKNIITTVSSDKGVDKLCGFFYDITKTRQIENKVVESEANFRKLVGSSPLATIVTSTNGENFSVNKKYSELFGYSNSDVSNMDQLLKVMYPDQNVREMNKKMWVEKAHQYEKDGSAFVPKKYWVNAKDGTPKFIEFNFETIGELYVISFVDLTSYQNATKEIRIFSEVIRQSPISVIVTNIKGIIEYVNPFFTEISGYTYKEVIGSHPRLLRSGKHSDAYYEKMWTKIKSGQTWASDMENRKKNGDLFWENVIISPIYNDENELTNFVALKQHISNRKKLEEDLIVAKERAEESDRLKSAFLANMSHEIRTPLNSILGFSSLLNDEGIDKNQLAFYSNTIIDNGDHLLSIVNDILDISKIETQQLEPYRTTFIVNDLINEVIMNFTSAAEAKPIALSTTVDLTDRSLSIYTDVNLLRRVLFNLVGNAIKFTEKGYVQIDYQIKYGAIEFEVSDTGIGIDKDLHAAVFERFRQAEAETTRKYGGTGLGLAISKKIVNLLGGDMWLESEPNLGSKFSFTIPVK